MPLQEAFIEQFEAYEKQLNGARSGELHQQRRAAMEVLERSGLPGKKDEDYKYTPITRALEKQFSDFSTMPVGEDIPEIPDQWFVREEANVLVFVNGQFSEKHSQIVSPASEIKIQSLAEAMRDQPELLTRYFARQTAASSDSFVALNTALAHEGTFVYVPSGQVVSHPVYLYFVSDTRAGNTFSQVRNLFVLGANSQATFNEIFCHTGEHAGYYNATTELWLHDNAVAYYHKIQNEGSVSLSHWHYLRVPVS